MLLSKQSAVLVRRDTLRASLDRSAARSVLQDVLPVVLDKRLVATVQEVDLQ